MKKIKTLYKKTGNGKIQQWKIWVKGNTIFSESGKLDGKQVKSKDEIKSGKNTGRANATTVEEQAIAEAKSRYTKKKKEGYVDNIEDAKHGRVDKKSIKGGIIPMLAQTYKKKMGFPLAVQPKLDGIRAINSAKKGLYSRSRKRIRSVPHIEEAMKLLPELWGTNPDGELYNHKFKEEFEKISSAVRKEKKESPYRKYVQFHVYDVAIPGVNFEARSKWLSGAVKKLKQVMKKEGKKCPIKLVETRIVKNEEELLQAYDEFLEMGYEGLMARNLDSPYENPSSKYRSKHLQKVKVFEDAEFKVIDIVEGRGKLKGHVGAFICEIDDKKGLKPRAFRVKAKGKNSFLKKCFEDKSIWKGKQLTVQFQGWTKKNKVPRFPVGLRFRDMRY